MKRITIIIKALAITVLFITSNINGQNTALNFDGTAGANGAPMSGQLMFTSPMVPLTNSFTVMGWVDVNAGNTQIFTWGSGTVNKYILINTSFDQKIQIFSPLGVISLKSTTTIGGSWHHVAITNNSGAITIYVDGVSEATGTADFSSITPTQTSFGTAFINGIYQGSGNYDIDEFSIWSIALSGAQILTFKDTPPSGGESGLVAAYNFNPAGVTPGGDNTSLTTLNDLTGDYPGTLFGFPLTSTTGNYITSTNVAVELTYNSNYNIASASFNSIALSVVAQVSNPYDMLFNSDGSVLYVLGNVGQDINQYDLTTNYDISSATFNGIALSVATEETNPTAMLFNNDGSVLYVLGGAGEDINRYNLTTPYDISTASFNSIALPVSGQETAPTDMLFNNDGSVLYVMGTSGQDINQYNLSTNYDISTASFNNIVLSVSAQETSPFSMLFNNDGSVLYVMGFIGDDINQYNLSTNYDISTASFNRIALDVAAEEILPTAMFFNNDGTVLYVMGLEGADINQYDITTSYSEAIANNGTIDNINAVTITLSADTFTGANGSDLVADAKVSIGNVPTGLTAVLTKDSNTQVSLTFTGSATSHQSANDVTDLTFAFADTAFTTSAAASVINSGAASPFSSNVGIGFLDNTATVEFSIDTADDENVGANLPQLLVTGTVTATTTVTVTNAGTGSTNTGDYTFASPVTVTIPTGSYDGTLATAVTITGLSITGDTDVETDETIDFTLSNPIGDVIIGDVNIDSTTDTSLTYTITNDDVGELTYNNNNYNIAKATFNSIVLDVSGQETSPYSMLFNNDGSVLYVMGVTGDDINQYNLTTNYDISTASFNSIALDVSAQDTIPFGMLFNNDGSVLYVLGGNDNDINQYNLSTNYDISTASFNSIALSVAGQETAPADMLFNNDGSVLYVMGTAGDDINQYNLTTPYDISTASFNSIALSVAAQITEPFSILFNNDGSILYVTGFTVAAEINQYNLTTPYDISTASFNSIALNVSVQDTFPLAMLFNNDGTALYVMGLGGQDVNQYDIPNSNYSEVAANNGTIDNTNAFTITLSNDTFTGANGSDFVADAKVSIGNVPTGLTAVLTKDSNTQVSLTFTGVATSHQSANNVADLTFAFTDTAFTATAAASVVNSGAVSPFSSNVGIGFLDNTATVEFSVDTADDENVGANLPQFLVTGTVAVVTTVRVTNAGTGSTNIGDYTFASPVTVTIPIGSYDGTLATAVSITGLSIIGDTDVETDETIDFTLSNPTGDVIIGDVNSDSITDTNLTYTITNDDVTLGINDFEMGSLKLYPNPAKEKITLVNKQNIALQKLDIYDITGRLIYNFDMKNSSTETVLDVSLLSSGNYIIIISGEDGGSTTKKLIIK